VYVAHVVNRIVTGEPLLSKALNTSFANNTLNASWLPLPGMGHEGGGLFFRTMGAKGTSSYNAVGFTNAQNASGIRYARASLDDILRDDPADRTKMNTGADPRAAWRPARSPEEFFVTYQTSVPDFPGRHTFISHTSTPLNLSSWRRFEAPMFASLIDESGKPASRATVLVPCNNTDASQRFALGKDGLVRAGSGMECLSVRSTAPDQQQQEVGLVPCTSRNVTRWENVAAGKGVGAPSQLRIKSDIQPQRCLDVDRGKGPPVDLWACHSSGDKDYAHQLWEMDLGGFPGLFRSASAADNLCLAVRPRVPNDSGTALWFPFDETFPIPMSAPDTVSEIAPKTGAMQYGGDDIFAVATFGELRGGDLSLVSSRDMVHWTDRGVFLRTRPDHWDNATLSTVRRRFCI
jgi:hypothetical protein